MKVYLETARLTLRELTLDDAVNLFDLDADPEVMRYIGPHRLADADAYRQQIAKNYMPYYAEGRGHGFWAAVERATGAFLGWFHLRDAQRYRFAEEAGYVAGDLDLGYRFRRSAWGTGYATEGAEALVHKGFIDLGAEQVVATALVDNAASIRVLEKAGLTRMHEFLLPGYGPAVKYGLGRARFHELGRAGRCASPIRSAK